MKSNLTFEQSRYLDNLCKTIFDIGNIYGEFFLLSNGINNSKKEELKLLLSNEKKMYDGLSMEWLIAFITYFGNVFCDSKGSVSFSTIHDDYNNYLLHRKNNDNDSWNNSIIGALQQRIFKRISVAILDKSSSDNNSSSKSFANDYVELYTSCVLRDLISLNSNHYLEFAKYDNAIRNYSMEKAIINTNLDPRNIDSYDINMNEVYYNLFTRIKYIVSRILSFDDESLEIISSNNRYALEFQLLVLRSCLVLFDDNFKEEFYNKVILGLNIDKNNYNVVCRKLNKVFSDSYYKDRERYKKSDM